MTDQEIISDWLEKYDRPASTWSLRKQYKIGWHRATRLAAIINGKLKGIEGASPPERENLEKLEKTQVGENLSVSIESGVPLTPEELIAKHNLDPDEWELIKFSSRSWDTQYQGRVITLYYSRADLKPRTILKDTREVIEKWASSIPAAKLPKVDHIPPITIDDENLLIINISDIHVGKLFRDPDGELYDIQTATKLYLSAVKTLLERAKRGQTIARIVHVVGNDALHVDHGNNTTKGTPQDVVGYWREAFEAARDMFIEATNMLREVAPVDIIVVPGNHDEEKAALMGYLLEAYYRATDDVTIINPWDTRVFYRWGDVLLGFTHGKAERYNTLPAIMAMHPDWSATRFHEWHIGHVHHEKEFRFLSINNRDGVVIHVHPSLTKPDRWHKQRGFVTSIEAAISFVYNKKYGNVATYKFYGIDS